MYKKCIFCGYSINGVECEVPLLIYIICLEILSNYHSMQTTYREKWGLWDP